MSGNMIVVRLNAKGYSRYGFNVDLSFHKSKSGKWQIFDDKLCPQILSVGTTANSPLSGSWT
jgi:hypothetical protein